MESEVSVILVSYNQEKYLKQSIQSILQQTYIKLELIILDDCSTDNSWEIINSFNDKRIRAYRSPKNMRSRGEGMTRYAIEHLARGKYIAIQHSCDYWKKDKLEKQVQFLENDKNKDYGAVFTLVDVVTETGDAYSDSKGFYYDIFEKDNRDRFEWLRYFFDYGNCLCHNSVLIRKECHKKYGLFVMGLQQIPDFYKWIRLCLNKEIYIIQEHLTGFRMIKGQRGASRYNIETSIRSSVEMFLIVKQYRNLRKYEDFVRVFPEVKKIMNKQNFDCDFALAWVCLLPGRPNYYRLFGYQLMFDLINSKKNILMTSFNYSIRDFWNENGQFDIFGLFPPDEEKICSLFFDYGEGYTEQMSKKIKYMFGKKEQYIFNFYISKKNNMYLKRLRFDPIEEIFIKCKVISAYWGKKELELKAVSKHVMSDEGEIFLTTDPNYEIVIPEENVEGTIRIILNMNRLKDIQLEKYLLEGRME